MELNQEKQTTPDNDLGAIMRDGLAQFDITDDAEHDAVAPASAPASAPGPAAQPTGVPAGDPPSPPAPFRFTSHPEAEKGYKHLQADFTRVSQENKTLAEKLSAIEQEKANQAAQSALELEFETFAEQKRMAMLNDIDALEPDDKDYKTQVAKVQARYDKEMFKASQKLILPAVPVEQAPPVPAAPAVKHEVPPAGVANEIEQVKAYTREFIAKPENGFKPDDPAFWGYAAQAPDTDEHGNPLTLDDQIRWAMEQTETYHASIRSQPSQQSADAAAANRAHLDMPMGRAASGTPPGPGAKEDNTPYGLSDALADATEARRL